MKKALITNKKKTHSVVNLMEGYYIASCGAKFDKDIFSPYLADIKKITCKMCPKSKTHVWEEDELKIVGVIK
jgi:hypothetical protein